MAWTWTAVDSILTAGRLIIHWRKRRKLQLDDFFNVTALLLLVGFMLTWQQYVPGLIRLYMHENDDRPDGRTHYSSPRLLKYYSANMGLFWCTKYSVKASFLALYWHIFKISKSFRIAWMVLTAYTGACFLITFFGVFTRCGSLHDFMNTGTFAVKLHPTVLTDDYCRSVPASLFTCSQPHVYSCRPKHSRKHIS